MTTSQLIVRQIEMGPMMNYVYLVGCPRTRAAAVIDPAWEAEKILNIATQLDLRLEHVLITHAHPDHVNGLEAILDATNARVYMGAREISFMREMAALYNIPIEFVARRAANFQSVADNEAVRIGEIPVVCIHTPGHTPGSLCFLIDKNLFTGDTLFIDACGRVDLPGGDPQKMWWSLNRRLRALDDDIVLYPGHNYGDRAISTLGEQKRTNPYMQFASADDFVRAMGGD